MRSLRRLLAVVGVVAAAGCGSPGRVSEVSSNQALKPPPGPSNEEIQAAAPLLAEAVNRWHKEKATNKPIVIRGPLFVGMAKSSASETTALGAALGESLNQHVDAGVLFSARSDGSADAAASLDAVYDSQALWELRGTHDGERASRITLVIINPRDGQTVFTTEQDVTTRPAVVVREQPPVVDAPAPEFAPAPSPADAAPKAVGDDRDRIRYERPSASIVLPLEHGALFFESDRLAERVIVLHEESTILPSHQLRVRLVLTSRKGKKTLQVRGEFYNEHGRSAGSVREVEYVIREGRSSSVALVSRLPAVRYVFFVKD